MRPAASALTPLRYSRAHVPWCPALRPYHPSIRFIHIRTGNQFRIVSAMRLTSLSSWCPCAAWLTTSATSPTTTNPPKSSLDAVTSHVCNTPVTRPSLSVGLSTRSLASGTT